MAINKIEMQDTNGNILYPHTTGEIVDYSSTQTVNQKINETLTNLTNLKAGLATAVNNKTGGSLTSDSSLTEMTSGINSITTLFGGSSDATATAGQILTGKTAYVKGAKVTGTMADRGAATGSIDCGASYTIPAGYHNGSGKVTANSLASQTSATATAGQILTGQTAYVNGTKITGTMPSMTNIGSNHANATGIEIGTHTAGDSNMYMYLGIPAYTYTADNTWVRYLASNVASKIGLTADKIVSGNNIMGVAGTATASSMGGLSGRKFTFTKTLAYGTAESFKFGSNIASTIRGKWLILNVGTGYWAYVNPSTNITNIYFRASTTTNTYGSSADVVILDSEDKAQFTISKYTYPGDQVIITVLDSLS